MQNVILNHFNIHVTICGTSAEAYKLVQRDKNIIKFGTFIIFYMQKIQVCKNIEQSLFHVFISHVKSLSLF